MIREGCDILCAHKSRDYHVLSGLLGRMMTECVEWSMFKSIAGATNIAWRSMGMLMVKCNQHSSSCIEEVQYLGVIEIIRGQKRLLLWCLPRSGTLRGFWKWESFYCVELYSPKCISKSLSLTKLLAYVLSFPFLG